MTSKECIKCNTVLPLELFPNVVSKGRTYKHSYCKPCMNQYTSPYIKKLRMVEAYREVQRHYYLDYVDRIRYGGLRETVMSRDKETCRMCGMKRDEHRKRFGRDITIDHIDGNGARKTGSIPNNVMSNLRVLCIPCNIQAYQHSKSC